MIAISNRKKNFPVAGKHVPLIIFTKDYAAREPPVDAFRARVIIERVSFDELLQWVDELLMKKEWHREIETDREMAMGKVDC